LCADDVQVFVAWFGESVANRSATGPETARDFRLWQLLAEQDFEPENLLLQGLVYQIGRQPLCKIIRAKEPFQSSSGKILCARKYSNMLL